MSFKLLNVCLTISNIGCDKKGIPRILPCQIDNYHIVVKQYMQSSSFILPFQIYLGKSRTQCVFNPIYALGSILIKKILMRHFWN